MTVGPNDLGNIDMEYLIIVINFMRVGKISQSFMQLVSQFETDVVTYLDIL